MMAKRPAERYQSARSGQRPGGVAGAIAKCGRREDRRPRGDRRLRDTVHDSDHGTQKIASSGAPRPGRDTGSGERPRIKPLPMAKPLEEAPAASDADPLELLLGLDAMRLPTSAGTAHGKSSHQAAHHRSRGQGLPSWAWLAITAGVVAVLGLVLLLVSRGR